MVYFTPDDGAAEDILQELYDKGLIWAINHAILHPAGYNIAVEVKTDTPEKVTRLAFVKGEPGDEVLYSVETGLMGYEKWLHSQWEGIREEEEGEWDERND